jgi:hypothetical protein
VPTRNPLFTVAVVVVALVLLAGACRRDERARQPDPPITTSRDHGVAEHSRAVMPFDLSRTTHTFAPVPDGLIETVQTMAPVDPAQVEAIRGHLHHEAERFRVGDWSDPARIHGDDMPGLAELQAGYRRIVVAYEDVPAGGRLTYSSEDPAWSTPSTGGDPPRAPTTGATSTPADHPVAVPRAPR